MKDYTEKKSFQDKFKDPRILSDRNIQAIVVGMSAGGIKGLTTILKSQAPAFFLPMIIVSHRLSETDDSLERAFSAQFGLKFGIVEDKTPIKGCSIFMAPPNYHLLVEMDHRLSLSSGPPINYARPSIDITFETAAEAYGRNLIGVILTGASSDGAEGIKRIKQLGGITIIQDPDTAEHKTMPTSALEAIEPDFVLSLQAIGSFLKRVSINTRYKK